MKWPVFFPLLLLFYGISLSADAQVNSNVKRTLSETGHQIVFSAFNADGSFLVTSGSDSSLRVWNYERKTIHRTLTGLKARPNIALFTPDSKYVVSGGRDNMASMWDLTMMPSKVIRTFEGHKGSIKSLDISPDGRLLATGSEDKTVRIWELQSASLIYELKGHSKDVNVVAFSSDGKILASGGADGVINLWNATNGGRIVHQNGHKGYVRDLIFSSDGKMLASCGDDKLIYLWQVPGLNKSATLEGHRDRVQIIDFSPDGKSLISGGWDRLIILWDVAGQKSLMESEKQKQIIVSLDICPAQPDFISSCYESENLETWVITGLDETQWKKPLVNMPEKIQGVSPKTAEQNLSRIGAPEKTSPEKALPAGDQMIRVFSPEFINGEIIYQKNNIILVGQVNDSAGISAFIINKKPVPLSEAGVFQYNLNLRKGENILEMVAINKKMRMDERRFIIDCTAEDALAEAEEITDISKGKYYALLIGINDYEDPKINDLDNPVKDAASLGDVLLANYTFEKENIIFLKDPALEELYTTLEELGKKLTVNDNLLIFYAGHGYWDARSNIGYWLPSDASKSSTVKWFRNSTLRDFIGSIQTRHTILIADACFSGAIFKTRGADMENEELSQGIEKLYELPSRKAMTSGILQEVPDESMFIRYLVKRLQENKERFLSSELLFSTFKIAVMNNSPIIPMFGVIQNVGDEGGDFIFIKR